MTPINRHEAEKELLPCPFCGHPAKQAREVWGINDLVTGCTNKICICESYMFPISDWNTRAKQEKDHDSN